MRPGLAALPCASAVHTGHPPQDVVERYLRLFVKVSLVDLMAAKMRIRILWNRLPKALGESFSKMCHRPMRLAGLLSMRLPLAAMGPTGTKLDMLTGSLCTIGYQVLATAADTGYWFYLHCRSCQLSMLSLMLAMTADVGCCSCFRCFR